MKVKITPREEIKDFQGRRYIQMLEEHFNDFHECFKEEIHKLYDMKIRELISYGKSITPDQEMWDSVFNNIDVKSRLEEFKEKKKLCENPTESSVLHMKK